MTETDCQGRTTKNRIAARAVSGFTLVEFAVVMLISGLIMAAAVHGYKVYLMDKYQRAVYDKLAVLNSSFSVFSSVMQRYPCPSDPTLPSDSAQAGIENCAAAWALAPGDCTASGGICRVDGARNTAALGLPSLDPVFTGGIPYKTIRETTSAATQSIQLASLVDTLDPWGFQMSYAVTASQTDTMTFNSSYGAIDIQTEAGVSLIQPIGSAHFVLVSHGENHKGAYNQQGRMPFPCTAGTADVENCNRTSTFVSGLRNLGAGAMYFDDVILQRSYTMSELWKFGDTANVMYNANAGNVGVGLTEPTQKLDINGNIRSTNLRTDEFCDRGGANCWGPEKIGGSGMSCGPPSAPGKVMIMRGIRGAEVAPLCFEIDLPTVMNNQRCANPGEYVVGFTSAGNIICEIP
ncbi:MAG: prepilin-type N-terminal cleavage/methylation domain-containing protein [Alphaproteobacteria bacterium]|nr:prepilin-type N-terminal cleavage/methylation domain-containing protein [Alphaproteobacteria bacterium]